MSHGTDATTTRMAIGIEGPGSYSVLISPTDEGSGRWHRFLNALWDEGVIASLSDRAYRVLGALLRLRRDDGSAFAPVSMLCSLTGYAERTVRAALAELRNHARRLLAVQGRDVFLILPGWVFAQRKRQEDLEGGEVGTTVPPARHNCAVLGTTVPTPCVPHRETRARSQPEEKRDKTRVKPPSAQGEALAGCQGQGQSLFGSVPPREVLIEIGLREPLLTATAELPGLTGEEVARVAAQVRLDRSIGNPAVITADRLFSARKRTRPALGRRANLTEQQRRAVASLERIRQGGAA